MVSSKTIITTGLMDAVIVDRICETHSTTYGTAVDFLLPLTLWHATQFLRPPFPYSPTPLSWGSGMRGRPLMIWGRRKIEDDTFSHTTASLNFFPRREAIIFFLEMPLQIFFLLEKSIPIIFPWFPPSSLPPARSLMAVPAAVWLQNNVPRKHTNN